MRFVINVRACETLPRGYGFAYHGSYSDTVYCAPIPFNFIIGAWHNFYWYCLVRGLFKQSPLIAVQQFWRGKGFNEGETYGYEKGIRHAKIAQFIQTYAASPKRVRDLIQGGSAADADRPGGGQSRAFDYTCPLDATRIDSGNMAGAPCGSDPIAREMSEGTQSERPELRPDVLHFSSPADPDTFPECNRADTGPAAPLRVDDDGYTNT